MTFSAAQIAELDANKDHVKAITLFEAQFRDGTYYASDTVNPITVAGNVYDGRKGVISASEVSRENGFIAQPVTYKFHALSDALITTILTDSAQYFGKKLIRSIALYIGDAMIGDPIVVHTGIMDKARFRRADGEEFVEVIALGRFADRLAPVRYYTDRDQQDVFSGDRAFEYKHTFHRRTILDGWANPS